MSVTPIKLRQLRYFVAVAEAKQLTDAARRLEISQPTLSQALAQLEAQLGVRLLERHARGVRLTDAGTAFLEKAGAAVTAADQAAEVAQAFERAESSVLSVGFHWHPLTRWAPMFQRLCSAHPGATVRWKRVSLLQAGPSLVEDVDVGLLVEPPAHPQLGALVLEREPRVVMMAPGHPLADREMLTVADILYRTFMGAHPSVDRRWVGFWTLDEERGGPPRFTDDRVANAEQAAAVVASGRAITTTPAAMAANFPHPGIVGVPLVDARPAALALVWRTNHDNPLVDELIAVAREMTREQRAGEVTEDGATSDGARPRGRAARQTSPSTR
jgi:DNA-binding transcriptional LysR family regulator